MMKSLQFEFPYINSRPTIMAKLHNNGIARYFEFLVDSGADYTLISKSNAVLLGIDVDNLKKNKTKVEIANLKFINVYKVFLTITIGSINLKIPIMIADGEVECLLGRKGIFDVFDVLFQEQRQKLVFIKTKS